MKPAILIVIADYRTDENAHLRELGNELDRVVTALNEAQVAGLCQVITLADATPEKIRIAFENSENPICIFHFAGHANGYELLWQKSSKNQKIKRKDLATFLAAQPELQLVFLNACATRRHVEGLRSAGIPTVIATSGQVADQIAREIATIFYKNLGKGKTLHASFEAMQKGMLLSHPDRSTLYQQVDDYKTLRGFGAGGDKQAFPWGIFPEEDLQETAWSLPAASKNPLFGLPIPNVPFPNEPYKGLKWFTEKDARIFFGRGYDIKRCYELLMNERSDQILLLYGKSGVGKSSFLHAGLLPRLAPNWDVHHFRLEKAQDLQLILTQLEALSVKHVRSEKTRQLFVLDQLEEILIDPTFSEMLLLKELIEVAQRIIAYNQAARLVLSFRKEYLAEIKAAWDKFDDLYTTYYLAPLSTAEIKQVVNGIQMNKYAREKYKVQIESGLAEQIATDLGRDKESHIAPALQIILTKLWQQVKKDQDGRILFSKQAYETEKLSGGILLYEYVIEQINILEKTERAWVQTGLIWDFLYFFTTPYATAKSQGLDTILASYHHIPRIAQLLNVCKNVFLLTEGVKKNSVRLSHDSIAPFLINQYNESDDLGQRARRLLETRFSNQASLEHGQELTTDRLLSDWELDVVEEGISGMRVLHPDEEKLVKLSQKASTKRQRQADQQRLIFHVGVALIMIIAMLAGWFAVETQASQKQNSEALLSLACQHLRNGNIAGAVTDYHNVWDLDFHRAALIDSLGQWVESYIFHHAYTSADLFLNLISNFPYDKKTAAIWAELTFIYAFSDQHFVANNFLHQIDPQIDLPDPIKNPNEFKRIFTTTFSDQSFQALKNKYLPHVVEINPEINTYACQQVLPLPKTFFIGEAEISVEQFSFFYNTVNKANWLDPAWDTSDRVISEQVQFSDDTTSLSVNFGKYRQPVNLSWYGADAYCRWLGGVLPDTSETQHAAFGHLNQPLDQDFFERHAWSRENSKNDDSFKPIKTRAPNPQGVYDIWGNAAEWLRDVNQRGNRYYLTSYIGQSYNWPGFNGCVQEPRDPKYSHLNGFRVLFNKDSPILGVLH